MEPSTPPERKGRLWRLVRLISGWSLVVLGIVGLVLPILQGVLFLGLGLSILAVDRPWARRALHWIRDRFSRHKRPDSQR